MPVIKGIYGNNELQAWNYLVGTMKLNTAAACGVLANINKESGFKASVEGDLNLSGGSSFGLCQWRGSRKENLRSHCRSIGLSMSSVEAQLSFMHSELKSSYKSVYETLTSVPNNPAGAYEAARKFCVSYEVPANSASKAIERGTLAQNEYWNLYSVGDPLPTGAMFPTNHGSKIVEIARQQEGKPYDPGRAGPYSFSPDGLVHYCYNQAGYEIERRTSTKAYYDEFLEKGKTTTLSDIKAGDLLFYSNSSGVYLVAIADGEGGRIYVNTSSRKVVVDKDTVGNPSAILRILSDSETYGGGYGPVYYEDAVEDFTSLTTIDPYSSSIISNLSTVKAEGFDYGYLIDLTHKGEFKFYIPEFTETAGANWESVNIIGRSVDIKSYSSTTSRSITVSLDLYAGVGLYSSTGEEDIVGKLHRDANFIKSLEYPDYSNAIVRPPATVQLVLGAAIHLVGVVSDVSVEHMKPLDSQNRSMYLKVSFTVTQVATNPPDYSDIKEGRYVLANTSNLSSETADNTNVLNSTK